MIGAAVLSSWGCRFEPSLHQGRKSGIKTTAAIPAEEKRQHIVSQYERNDLQNETRLRRDMGILPFIDDALPTCLVTATRPGLDAILRRENKSVKVRSLSFVIEKPFYFQGPSIVCAPDIANACNSVQVCEVKRSQKKMPSAGRQTDEHWEKAGRTKGDDWKFNI